MVRFKQSRRGGDGHPPPPTIKLSVGAAALIDLSRPSQGAVDFVHSQYRELLADEGLRLRTTCAACGSRKGEPGAGGGAGPGSGDGPIAGSAEEGGDGGGGGGGGAAAARILHSGCSACKLARYCSRECQRAECRPTSSSAPRSPPTPGF